MELTAMEHRGSARKGKEEFSLSGLGERLLAAAHLGRYKSSDHQLRDVRINANLSNVIRNLLFQPKSSRTS
jgi:hypothetical protein